jgi:hypothetical protein
MRCSSAHERQTRATLEQRVTIRQKLPRLAWAAHAPAREQRVRHHDDTRFRIGVQSKHTHLRKLPDASGESAFSGVQYANATNATGLSVRASHGKHGIHEQTPE